MRALWILAASTTVVGETTTFRVTRLGRGEGACSRRGLTGAVPTLIDRRSRPQVNKSRVCGLRSRVARTVRGVGSFSAAATALSADASNLANASVAACRLWRKGPGPTQRQNRLQSYRARRELSRAVN